MTGETAGGGVEADVDSARQARNSGKTAFGSFVAAGAANIAAAVILSRMLHEIKQYVHTYPSSRMHKPPAHYT